MISVREMRLLPRHRPSKPPILLMRLILKKNMLKAKVRRLHLHGNLNFLFDLDAERFLDEYVYQSHIILHVLQELCLKVINPSLVPTKDICRIKDVLTGLKFHNVLHLITQLVVALLQGLTSGCILARLPKFPDRESWYASVLTLDCV